MRSIAATALIAIVFGFRPSLAAAQGAATAPTEYVEINGNKIGYRTLGSGAPVVLLNRMRGTLDTWDPVFLDYLAKTNRIVTVDYPGTGYSGGTFPTDMTAAAGFVKEFAARISLTRFAVLGWSWGGLAAQALVLQFPDIVSHAVLVGTAPPGPGQVPIQQVWLDRALKPVNDLDDEVVLFFEPTSESSRRAARLSHERIYSRPDVVSKIPSRQEEFLAFIKAGEGFRADADRRQQLMKSRIPILILCGDHDPSVPATNWYPLIGQIPRAQLVVLPESGHGPQHQYPELSTKYISAFLQQSPQ
jgi:pimeloyl-ACP methyl ester carboxylesterase